MILKDLIKRKKTKGLMSDYDKDEAAMDAKADDVQDKEDGLAPKIEIEVEKDKDEADEDIMEMAEAILGRKPMSMTKGGEDEDEMDMEAVDEDVLSAMTDDRVLEALEGGKKPKKLWERVQAKIAKMKK